MIQLTRQVTILGSETRLERLRRQFEEKHFVRLRQFVEPELCRDLACQIDGAEFEPKTHKGIAEELVMKPNVAVGLLHILVNDQVLFDAVARITGCEEIGRFLGRVYRMAPDADHYDSWHDDLVDRRVISMSINFTTQRVRGGILEIRNRDSGEILSRVANTGLGDAVIFRLAPELQHRVTELHGTIARTAFAGWFHTGESFPALLRERALENPRMKAVAPITRKA